MARVASLRIRRVSTRDLLPDAWTLRRSVSIGDGPYVALARRLDAALVTADMRLARAPDLRITVLSAQPE